MSGELEEAVLAWAATFGLEVASVDDLCDGVALCTMLGAIAPAHVDAKTSVGWPSNSLSVCTR